MQTDPTNPSAAQPPGTPLSDEDFVVQLTRIQGPLHTFLTAILSGHSCVDDVLQLTNVSLWKRRADFAAGTNFPAWAFAVARWEARGWIASQRRHDVLVFSEDVSELIAERIAGEASSPCSPHAMIEQLHLCLAKLKERDRQLIVQHHQNGCSLAECGQRFGIGEGSLKVILFRIRRNLRRCIESKMAIECAKS